MTALSIGAGELWTPPADMVTTVARDWATFYRACYKNYGLRPEQYRALYLAQAGRCFICRTAKGKHPDDPKGTGGRRLGVDHNHALGDNLAAVRGLLCSGGDRTCNRIIGWLGQPALERAAGYLSLPPARRVLTALAADWPDHMITGMVVNDAQDRSSAVRTVLHPSSRS